ncbi:MAG: hypothetical protein ACR2OG_00170 [Gemmatimonadaceae bacterium]
MIAGHIGFALGARRIRASPALIVLLGASMAPDLAEGVLRIAGASYQTATMSSHSIPAAAGLAALLAGLPMARGQGRAAVLIAGLVGAHLLADYLTGLKPTWPGGPEIGLRLFRHPAVDFLLEGSIVLGGWLLYRNSLGPRARASRLTVIMLLMLIAEQAAFDSLDRFKPALHRLVDPHWP